MSATNDKGTGMTREEAKSILRNAAWLGTNEDRERIERAVELLCGETCEDAVSRRVFEQVMWERDVAIDQLKELGYGFGEKPKTGHWIIHDESITLLTGGTATGGVICSECGYKTHNKGHAIIGCPYNYCPSCGAKMEKLTESEYDETIHMTPRAMKYLKKDH